ncbi:hypothetical protein Pyn_25354 [Prunus yedoensis var. nudiflora]|uniref:Uncharacterized protein n=1 Tax=Prunus yedoensis var. nudiflora TaxID=2094558 RepID=A0A314UFY8_PRUYE|nr:hypothetical protein Pyn_25354 [Prunus yedoensis var. nudiflora]
MAVFLERNPLSGTLSTLIQTIQTNISPVKSQHGLNNMGLKRLAQDEWVEKGCSPKKRRKSPQGEPCTSADSTVPIPIAWRQNETR